MDKGLIVILGIGIDIVSVKRIEMAYKKFGDRFIQKIFSAEEARYCLVKRNPFTYLAARFAAKEAYIKAMNLPPGFCFNFSDIFLKGDYFGKKKLETKGKLEEYQEIKGVTQIHISLSHEKDFAIATVILEK
jgi:holo-[acyl-carrier protein] synthase